VKISYAITVCYEYDELKKLVSFLKNKIRENDEIVVTFDRQGGTSEVRDYLSKNENTLKWFQFDFNKDFAELKNFSKSKCSGDYIFHLDADEIPNEILLKQLPQILEINDVDLLWIPRVNIVNGLTNEHIKKWGWQVSEKGWVNFPDYQSRVFKNEESILWSGKVHEMIQGAKTYSHLPPHEELSLYHEKEIERQEKQNNLYGEIS
jgi:glycosyltransferase involved in cell wall biosynthesis|tara:strand:- start:893 stop:1510 length:618 start_codon:yes stop_codon:yes gene_type:complete